MTIDLADLLHGTRLKGGFNITPPSQFLTPPPYSPHGAQMSSNAYRGTLQLEVRPNPVLEEAGVGARFLTVSGCEIKEIPSRWKLPREEFDVDEPSPDAGKSTDYLALPGLCDDVDENPYKYVLSLDLLPGKPPVKIPTGSLKFILSENHAQHDGTKTLDPSAEKGRWAVQFKDYRIFLSKNDVSALSQHLGTGALVEGKINRVMVESVEDDDPDDRLFGFELRRTVEVDLHYRAAVSIAMDQFLAMGLRTVHSEVNVRPDTVTDEEKAAELTSREERSVHWLAYQAEKAKKAAEKGAAVKSPTAKGGDKKGDKKDDKKAAAGGKPDPKAAAGKGGKDAKAAAPVAEAPKEPQLHPYDKALTVLTAVITVNAPFYPRPPTPPPAELTVEDLIPQRGKALEKPAGLDASQEFRLEVSNAVAAIAKEYASALATFEHQSKGEMSSIPTDQRRAELFKRLKGTGTYDSIKETMKRCAVKIVRERFAYLPGYSDAKDSPGKDELFAHVYAYLVGQMHSSLNATFAEAEKTGVKISSSFATSEPSLPSARGVAQQRDATTASTLTRPHSATTNLVLATAKNLDANEDKALGVLPSEPMLLRLRRIALECEFSGNFDRANRMHQTRISIAEEEAAKGNLNGLYDPSVWYEYGLFCLRRGDLLKGATCFREALSCNSDFVPALIAFAALQCCRGHADESVIFCLQALSFFQSQSSSDEKKLALRSDNVSERDNILPLIHVLHSVSLELAGQREGAGSALSAAIQSLGKVYTLNRATPDDIERSATAGGVYLILSRYLLDLELNQLARLTIERAHNALLDTDAPRSQRVDVLCLRSRQYISAMNAMTSVELREYSSTKSATGAVRSGPSKRSMRLDGEPIISASESSNSSESKKQTISRIAAGRAYDGALLVAEEATAGLERACELSNTVAEAWMLRGIMNYSGLAGASRKRSVSSVDVPLAGSPDLSDIELDALSDAKRFLELASSSYIQPIFYGYQRLINDPIHDVDRHGPSSRSGSPSSKRDDPSLNSTATLTKEQQQRAEFHAAATQQPQVPQASKVSAFIITSSSGVGGGLLASDEYALIRLQMRLGAVQLQLAAHESSQSSHASLSVARATFVRAIQSGRVSATSSQPGNRGGPWSLSWLGVGRATWAMGDRIEAETALGEANAYDNQNPLVWAWLAFICLNTDPLRDREAAAALDQALKNWLSGNNTEAVVLLHTLADRYRSLGQTHVAAGLLRRAIAFLDEPVSGAHQDAGLHAQMALAQILTEGGAFEDALSQYRSVMNTKLLSGVVLPQHLKDSIRDSRHGAASAAAALLTRLGRPLEAKEVMIFYGKKAQESNQQVITQDESAAEIIDTGIA
jgi:tetratricopeptide (TPR) repeat protein